MDSNTENEKYQTADSVCTYLGLLSAAVIVVMFNLWVWDFVSFNFLMKINVTAGTIFIISAFISHFIDQENKHDG